MSRAGHRIGDAFARAHGQGRAALVAYVTFGDPTPAASIEIVAAIAEAGADVIELGVPFSEPSADGPVIQAAMERALAAGGGLPGALDAVAALRARGVATPIVLFGYYNPIFVMGPEELARRAAAAGIDAVLTVDLPVEEIDELRVPLAVRGIGVIPLVAPPSTPERIAKIARLDAPFVYYISLTGVTGAAGAGAVTGERIEEVRKATGAPVAVGFGIRTAEDVAKVAAVADGVVVGSALVAKAKAAAKGGQGRAVAELVKELRRGLPRA